MCTHTHTFADTLCIGRATKLCVCTYVLCSALLFFSISLLLLFSLFLSYTTKTASVEPMTDQKWTNHQRHQRHQHHTLFFFVHENNSIRKMLRWSCPCLLLIFHHHFIDVGIIAAVRWNMLSIQLQKNAFIVVLVRFGSSFFFACFVRRCFVLFGSVHVHSSFVQFYNIDQAKLGICHFQYLICVSTICSIVFHAHIKYNLECIWAQKMELVNKTIGLFVENITHCECIKSNRIDPPIRIDLCIIRKNGNGICVKLKRQNN